MAYNRFYLNILLRIVILSLTWFGFFYFLIPGERFFTILFLGILLLVQIVWLFYYINMVNLNLSRFLLMLGEEETSIIPLRTKVEKTFGGLQLSFQQLNREMVRARLEKEYASVLVQQVVDHAAAGIMAWDQDGRVELINRSGLKLMDLAEVEYIHDLDNHYPGLHDWLADLATRGKGTWSLERKGWKIPLAFRASEFLLGDKNITLVSFQNILTEMEESEMESWEKLIRVLTHEVSNSVTPITTLGSSVRKCLDTARKQKTGDLLLSSDLAADITRSAELIEQRGNGLIDFISQYKTFMRLPDPDIRMIRLSELLDGACRMGRNLVPDLEYKINCSTDPPGIHCMGDHKMIEQVLLNLIRNALEAIPPDRKGRIELSGRLSGPGFASIQVKDNGRGIPEEISDQIFIPFFTTKEKGSGIGLSFCRRIIAMNGGNIRVKSTSESGSEIRFTLPVIQD